MDIALILTTRFPGTKWVLNGDSYAGLVWDRSNATPKPTEAELAVLWEQVLSETDYLRKRRGEYPSVDEQLEAIWEGGVVMEAMRARIQAINARHPKPVKPSKSAAPK